MSGRTAVPEKHALQKTVAEDERVVERACDMECDEAHQETREAVMHDPHGERPEICWERAFAEEDHPGEASLQCHHDPACRHADDCDIEEAMREPSQPVEQRLTGGGGDGMGGAP